MDFKVLGPLEVWSGGRPLALGGTKQRALLAILLLHANEVVSRDVLIDELWAAKPPPRASHTLETYVSRLRKTLHSDPVGEPLIVTRPPGYLLRVEHGQLDLHRFEQLRLQAVEERIEAELALGRHEAAVPELERLVAQHPLRERLRGQLML